eukprot:COSAG02_NODE_6091_length_3809_cov_10.668733_1_plen_22_part_10
MAKQFRSHHTCAYCASQRKFSD